PRGNVSERSRHGYTRNGSRRSRGASGLRRRRRGGGLFGRLLGGLRRRRRRRLDAWKQDLLHAHLREPLAMALEAPVVLPLLVLLDVIFLRRVVDDLGQNAQTVDERLADARV